MSAAESLNEHMTTQDLNDPARLDPEHYRIGDRGHELNEAEWACRKLAGFTRKRDDVLRAGEAEIAKVKAWMAGESTRYGKDIDYFETLLVSWWQDKLAEELAEVGSYDKIKQKSQRLPSGMVRARQLPDRVEVPADWADDLAHWGWCREKHEPDKKAILDSIKASGEIPEGVTFVSGEVKFSVVLGSGADKVD